MEYEENKKAKNISLKGYLKDIFVLQFLHIPFKKRNDKTGILSIHFISLLHSGQKLLGYRIDFPLGNL